MPTFLDLMNEAQRGVVRRNVSEEGLAILESGYVEVGPAAGITWLGEWDGATLYLEGDAVSRLGSTYISLDTHTNSAPPSAHWDLVAAKGAVGDTGATGPAGGAGTQGIQGEQGIQGNAGAQGNPGADGAAGSTGSAGPNSVSGTTATALVGLLKGASGVVQVASAPSDYVATGDSRLSDARTPTTGSVTNAVMATMTQKTYKGRTTASTGVPEDVAVATLKTDLTLVKGDVGLGSVDNTSDAAKPVSTATQTALDLKANLASPTFTGTPSLPTGTTAATQSAADSSTKLATTAFTTTADNLKANLASPTFTGTVTVPGLTLADATDLTISATTGTKIGQSGSKLGFYGVTPVVRTAALTQTYATASATHAAVTQLAAPAGATGLAAGAWSTAANRDLAIASINAARTDIANLKNFVNEVVDRLQALGLLQ